MEVILRETIDNLGRAGQVVKVADGYARNYLLPKKLAYVATPGNLKVIEAERQSLLRKEAKQKDDAEKLQQILEKAEITVRRKVGEHDALYGSSRTPILRRLSKRRASKSRGARSIWTITLRRSVNTQSQFGCLRTSQRMSS